MQGGGGLLSAYLFLPSASIVGKPRFPHGLDGALVHLNRDGSSGGQGYPAAHVEAS